MGSEDYKSYKSSDYWKKISHSVEKTWKDNITSTNEKFLKDYKVGKKKTWIKINDPHVIGPINEISDDDKKKYSTGNGYYIYLYTKVKTKNPKFTDDQIKNEVKKLDLKNTESNDFIGYVNSEYLKFSYLNIKLIIWQNL